MVTKVKLADTEFFVLLDLAQRAGKSEEEYLAELIREAAWRELTKQKEAAPCPS